MKRSKKLLSICLVLSMIGSTITPAISTMAETTDNVENKMLIHYDFNDVSSTIVPDQTGNGKAGVIRNYQNGGSEIVDVEIYGKKMKALTLPGGSDGGYLELPSGNTLVDNNEVVESITLSCWVNIPMNSGYQRIWDLGNDTSSYMYLLTDGYNYGATGYATSITKGGWSKEQSVEKGTPLELNKWILTTVTFDGEDGSLALYEDGKLIGIEENCDANLLDLGNTTQNYIGKGQFADPHTKMQVADFTMYNYAMTGEEVASLFSISDEERVNGDLSSINLGDLLEIKEDLMLPNLGVSGSNITWKSSNEDIVSAEGKVTRPSPEVGNTVVTLTATGIYNEAISTRNFEVTVIALPSNLEIVEYDLYKINLGNINSVTGDLTLPEEGEWGSKITWISSNENYLKNDGIIIRPVAGKEQVKVILTAMASMNEVVATKEFEITILPQYYLPSISEVADVEVTTIKGQSPTLPSKVNVTYNNGINDTLAVRWPNYIDKELYNIVGTFEVEGNVIDSEKNVKAIVTVIEDTKVAPESLSLNFDLKNISLDGDNILTQNEGRTVEYLKLLDSDRMLYNFRKTFGQDTKGVSPLGGWDEPTGLLRGHSTGHFISALSLAYASTGDIELKEKMDYMISEMRKLQVLSEGNAADFVTKGTAQSSWSVEPKEWGKGFISAYSPDQFALLEQYVPYATIWAPYYTLHKLMAGYLDAYVYGENEEALEIAKDLGLWMYDRLSACTPEQLEKMWGMYIAGEYGGMNESLATLYQITGEEKYLTTAKMFDNKKFFDNLSANVDDITGRHANQHIPQIVGAVKEYEATGDVYYYNVAENFWNMVIDRYAYSIGGVGRGEMFKEPYMLANNIDGNKNCETCAAYNMLKLTKDLYVYNPDDAKYMDYYERTLINQIVASQNQETYETMHNGTTYMLPIGPGATKSYGGDYDSFTCCHGTGMENHVKYQEAAYYTSEDNSSLYVNLYIPTTLDWNEKGITISQETNFPSEDSKLIINGNGTFELNLRVPYWATAGFTVKVNDEVVINGAEPSSYVSINREWKKGDIVEINMPYSIHLDKTHDKLDDSTIASVMYGPLVMVAKSDVTDFITLTLDPTLKDLIQVVEVDEKNGVYLESNNLTFVPIYTAYNFAYHTYFKINMVGTDEIPEVEEPDENQVDKSKLEEKYNSVKAYKEEDYTVESYKLFKIVLDEAKSVLDNDEATQENVDIALNNLNKAIDSLVHKEIEEDKDDDDISVDKSKLKDKYDEAKGYKKVDYTADSYNLFKKALDNAKIILDKVDATQDEVNTALRELNDKISELVRKSTNGNSTGSNNSSKLPNTGVESAMIPIALCVMAIGGAIVKKTNNK